LAGSLTADTVDLLPYLPYLLQDFWELGSDPLAMVKILQEREGLEKGARVLDLACGKGAVAVRVAEKLQLHVKGIDLISEFIEYAKGKAEEHGVDELCEFIVGDINEAVCNEIDYDAVILGGVGDVLGDPAQTLAKLKETIKVGGYILIDECYLSENASQADMQWDNYEYLTKQQWEALFKDAGLGLIAETSGDELGGGENLSPDEGLAAIRRRAGELSAQQPNKKPMFDAYVESQRSEYEDIDNNLVGVVWLLQK